MEITIKCNGVGELRQLRDELNRIFAEPQKTVEEAGKTVRVNDEIGKEGQVPEMLDEYYLFPDEIDKLKEGKPNG